MSRTECRMGACLEEEDCMGAREEGGIRSLTHIFLYLLLVHFISFIPSLARDSGSRLGRSVGRTGAGDGVGGTIHTMSSVFDSKLFGRSSTEPRVAIHYIYLRVHAKCLQKPPTCMRGPYACHNHGTKGKHKVAEHSRHRMFQ
jgi:hypothetical protein